MGTFYLLYLNTINLSHSLNPPKNENIRPDNEKPGLLQAFSRSESYIQKMDVT